MADNTTLCVNGELKPGDLVISAPQDSYAGLVGTVLAVNKAGTPEHDAETDNPGDDVHVDFTTFDYPDRRIGEIEDMFSLLYDEKKSFDECPIDDVIMSPDMLIRITGIGRGELAEILGSEEKAVAYCDRVFAEMAERETPAQAALHEPDAFEDGSAAALREQLIKRLDKNLSAYFDNFQSLMERRMVDLSAEIAAYAGAHFYLTERHNFHTSELEYLLRFKDPLSVVADQFELESAIEDHSAVMWNIFDKQEALCGGYTLVPEKSTPGYEDPEILLRTRLDENYEEYRRDMMDLSKEELFDSAAEIAAVEMAHDYLTQQHDFTEPEAVFFLKFRHPLEVASDRFKVQLFDISAEVNAIYADQERTLKSGYALAAGEHETAPIPQSKSGISTDKPSVMDQIRKARADAKESPPQKDSPAKDKGREI